MDIKLYVWKKALDVLTSEGEPNAIEFYVRPLYIVCGTALQMEGHFVSATEFSIARNT